MTNHRVGVSKMPNHRSIIELTSRANTSLDASIQKFHFAIAEAFADQILEPEVFVRRWYEVAIAHLDDDQMEDMATRFTSYARVFFQLKNAYFAERLRQEYDKLLKSSELPVKPWKPVAGTRAFRAEDTGEVALEAPDQETYTIKELREARKKYVEELAKQNPALPDLAGVDPSEWDTSSDKVFEALDSVAGHMAGDGGLPTPPAIDNNKMDAEIEVALTHLEQSLHPKRTLPDNFEDLKINDLRSLAKEWEIPTADLRSKEDYRQALRHAVDNQ